MKTLIFIILTLTAWTNECHAKNAGLSLSVEGYRHAPITSKYKKMRTFESSIVKNLKSHLTETATIILKANCGDSNSVENLVIPSSIPLKYFHAISRSEKKCSSVSKLTISY